MLRPWNEPPRHWPKQRSSRTEACLESAGNMHQPRHQAEPVARRGPTFPFAVLLPRLLILRSRPDAAVYVYDNNSTDRAAATARAAGAVVRTEPLQGTGNVVRRLLAERLDMVNAARVSTAEAAYRPGHRFGNLMLTTLVALVFGKRTTDMLSGYRVFSRRFVKTFPALAKGFEIETELTIHALDLRMPIAEVPTPYRARAPSSLPSRMASASSG
jgi:hypothetical protein